MLTVTRLRLYPEARQEQALAKAWRCDKCGILHDRDTNAAQNISLEAQRMIVAGTAGTANGGMVSRGAGRKSSVLARAVEVGSSVL
ncbi:MAG: hypothetical protein KGI54_06345 [Pseudomonadota bacterium]|nr:hypothetical protein [Pseudomonadota bacterium]